MRVVLEIVKHAATLIYYRVCASHTARKTSSFRPSRRKWRMASDHFSLISSFSMEFSSLICFLDLGQKYPTFSRLQYLHCVWSSCFCHFYGVFSDRINPMVYTKKIMTSYRVAWLGNYKIHIDSIQNNTISFTRY
jgi:hypothetical protein